MKTSIIGGVAALVLVGICVLLAQWRFGSIAQAIGYLNGQMVQVDRATIDLGTVALNKTIPVAFNLTNLHDEPAKIVGANASCSCVLPPMLPITLEPHTTVPVTFNFTSPDKSQHFSEEIELYLDGPVPALQLRITGVAQ